VIDVARVVVDPVTRIEGHLRIEIIVDEKTGKVVDALSSGTMWRGIELILRGRKGVYGLWSLWRIVWCMEIGAIGVVKV